MPTTAEQALDVSEVQGRKRKAKKKHTVKKSKKNKPSDTEDESRTSSSDSDSDASLDGYWGLDRFAPADKCFRKSKGFELTTFFINSYRICSGPEVAWPCGPGPPGGGAMLYFYPYRSAVSSSSVCAIRSPAWSGSMA
ncbi:Hypothetical predicted protein [Podarcis lilfordi]|uniref:Uncharacterized protein n=1 Tax=Podarcis lilfordi TaxID=74358 RepID=A0AA35LNX6_9SAUR|nr:Hypothetical predicted protein [Podarcis lilfordi]